MLKGFEEITPQQPRKVLQYADRVLSMIRPARKGTEIAGVSTIAPALDISPILVRQIVHYLRTHRGEPICSDQRGYWYADSPEALDDTIQSSEQRIRAIQEYVDELHVIRAQMAMAADELKLRDDADKPEQGLFF